GALDLPGAVEGEVEDAARGGGDGPPEHGVEEPDAGPHELTGERGLADAGGPGDDERLAFSPENFGVLAPHGGHLVGGVEKPVASGEEAAGGAGVGLAELAAGLVEEVGDAVEV